MKLSERPILLSAPSLVDDEPMPESEIVSEMLTVWRKLHLDLDSMSAIVGNNVERGLVHVVHEEEEGLTRLEVEDLPWNFEEEDHYRKPGGPLFPEVAGKILLTKEGVGSSGHLVVLEDQMNFGEEGTQDYIWVAYDASLSQYEGGDYCLIDDDWWDTAGQYPLAPVSLPKALNTAVLSEALQAAYVELSVYDAQYNSAFRVNAEDEDDAGENLNNNGSTDWWAAHVTAAFQGAASKDEDPYSEFSQLGITDRDIVGSGDGAFTFLETIRECADRCGGDSATFSQLEGEDVAHEVGHQFGLEHSSGLYMGMKCLMAGEEELGESGRDYDQFSPTSIDAIRDIDHPIEDAGLG